MTTQPTDELREDFLRNIKNHSMTIEMDNGVHRSIKFANGNSSNMYFRINTWPGHLCISGDMGTYVFAHTPDMFEFFRGDELTINRGYWTEKLQSISCFGSNAGNVKEFSAKATAENLKEYISEDRFNEMLDAYDTTDAMNLIEEWGISDGWEYLATKYTYHIQWCLYAIRWAIAQYDAPKEQAA